MEKRCLIFYVDDDWDDLDIFGDVCRELSYDVMLFDSALKMLHALEEVLPCALFLDLNMTQVNGMEVTREFKSHHQYKDIPIVIYSDSRNDKDIEKLYAVGADYYMPKEGSVPGIRRVIKEALGNVAFCNPGHCKNR